MSQNNNQTSEDKELHDAVHQMYPNPIVANKLVAVLASKKPIGWSSRSNAPYYNALYANEIKEYIDQMIINKEDLIYRYSIWCTEETSISKNTLYNRVYQSIRYLLECLDPEQKYAKWREEVEVYRQNTLGVIIKYKPGFGNNERVQLKPEMVKPKELKALWQKKLDRWLEEDEAEPFVQERLALTVEEQVEVKCQLAQLKTIQYSITESSIKVIRIN